MAEPRGAIVASNEPAPTQNWSTLLGKAIDDVSRIASAEIRLLGVQISASVEGAVDSLLPIAMAAAMLIGAEACLLAALVVLLHKWLEWWMAFGVTGIAALLVAIVIVGLMKSHTRKLTAIDASLSPSTPAT